MTHICVGNRTIIGSDNGLSHYMNQFWNIVNLTLRNKLQWNNHRNTTIFTEENASENVVCEMASILSRPQCLKRTTISLSSYVLELPRHPACFMSWLVIVWRLLYEPDERGCKFVWNHTCQLLKSRIYRNLSVQLQTHVLFCCFFSPDFHAHSAWWAAV